MTAATNLPWYKCTPAKFLSGDIMLCKLEEIGLFAIIEKIYWSRACDITKADLIRRIKLIPDHDRILEVLISENIIKMQGDKILIDYLQEQWDERTALHSKLSASGRKGAQITNAKKSATPQPPRPEAEIKKEERPTTGHFFYIGMEMFKHPVSKYVLDHLKISIDEFMITMPNVKTPAVLKQMDAENNGTQFADENHIRNTFKKLARILNAQNTNPQNTKSASVATSRRRPDTES